MIRHKVPHDASAHEILARLSVDVRSLCVRVCSGTGPVKVSADVSDILLHV